MNEQLNNCPRCGGNACYTQQVEEEVSTQLCFGCGYSTSTVMKTGSPVVAQAIESSPELYKDLMFTDSENFVWFPATVTIPGKGMVFVDGTNKDLWRWASVLSVEITEEEKKNFPEGQTHKMDMKNIQHFQQKDFMDALDNIKFFEVELED